MKSKRGWAMAERSAHVSIHPPPFYISRPAIVWGTRGKMKIPPILEDPKREKKGEKEETDLIFIGRNFELFDALQSNGIYIIPCFLTFSRIEYQLF